MAFNRHFSNTMDTTTHSMTRHQMDLNDKKLAEDYLNNLNAHTTCRFSADNKFDCSRLKFFRVKEIKLTEVENFVDSVKRQTLSMLTSMWSVNTPFIVFILYNGSELKYYVGSDFSLGVQAIFKGCFNGIEFYNDVFNFSDIFCDGDNKRISFDSVGFFHGNPIVRKDDSLCQRLSAIDALIGGTSGIPWALAFTCEPNSYDIIASDYHNWITLTSESSEFVSAQYTGGSGEVSETINTTKCYVGASTFNELAASEVKICEEAMQYGRWRCTIVGFAESDKELMLMGGLFTSQMRMGIEEFKRPFPFEFKIIGRVDHSCPDHFLRAENGSFINTSSELAEMIMMPVNDVIGLTVSHYVGFDLSSADNGDLKIGKLINNSGITECLYSIDSNSLNRHGLIIGLTGGGKTNTVKSLLYSISNLSNPIPFMIIEPAKKEYYETYKMGIDDIQVYSVGGIEGCTLKLNPFERIGNVPLQTHIDSIFAAFKASFIMYTPMPYVLETAIYSIYSDIGWDIENDTNIFGKDEYPTLEDLYVKIPKIVRDMGYDGKMERDLTGSLTARINSLRLGSKGNTLNVIKSVPMQKLIQGRVVIELDNVGDEDAKSFIISIILMQLEEVRKSDKNNYQLEIQHLLLIEEAHRLLKNVASGTGESADPRGAAVEYFCNMLAELRSKGQGFLVIDQIPSKLAPDLIKNTNLKIIHRTVAGEDRTLVGNAMNMTDEQMDYLACLKQGEAAVYSENDRRPKLVKLPYAGEYEIQHDLKNMTREQILKKTNCNCIQVNDGFEYKNLADTNPMCRGCRKPGCKWISSEDNLMSKALGQDVYKKFRSDLKDVVQSMKTGKELIDMLERNYRQKVDYITLGNDEVGFKCVDKLRCTMALYKELFMNSDVYSEGALLTMFNQLLKRHAEDE